MRELDTPEALTLREAAAQPARPLPATWGAPPQPTPLWACLRRLLAGPATTPPPPQVPLPAGAVVAAIVLGAALGWGIPA